jgi:hypothetical protein
MLELARHHESKRSRSWWPWCSGSIRGSGPRGAGSIPVGHPFADTEVSRHAVLYHPHVRISVKRSRARRRGPERAGYLDGLASPYMARGVQVPKSGLRSTTATSRSSALHLDVAGRSTLVIGPRLGTRPRGKGPRNPNRSASHDRDNASPAAGRRVPVIGHIETSRVRFPLACHSGGSSVAERFRSHPTTAVIE